MGSVEVALSSCCTATRCECDVNCVQRILHNATKTNISNTWKQTRVVRRQFASATRVRNCMLFVRTAGSPLMKQTAAAVRQEHANHQTCAYTTVTHTSHRQHGSKMYVLSVLVHRVQTQMANMKRSARQRSVVNVAVVTHMFLYQELVVVIAYQ